MRIPGPVSNIAAGFLLILMLAHRHVAAQAPTHAVVRGMVVDLQGQGMPFVNVLVVGTTDGAATDNEGRFVFTTRSFGDRVLRASAVGYEPTRHVFKLTMGDTISVRLVLKETLVTLDETLVTASAYTTGDAEGVTLNTLDVLLTPGSAAGIFRAMRGW